MALSDFIRSQFIDIIEWTDDSRDTLSFRFPDEDKEIKRGAQLIVRESQNVQFVYLGEFGDLFGPGKHTLTTDNIPVLSRLKGWKYGFESPFKADVYYVTVRPFTGNKWGTSNPIMVRDQDFGIVRVRAFGTYDFRIVQPAKFLKEVAGTDHHFRLEEFADVMRSRLVSVFSEALAEAKVPVLDVATRYSELGEALLPLINPILVGKYGIEMSSFVIENVSVPPEVEAAIDKRSSMAAVGNLNDYVKFQMAQGMEKGGSGRRRHGRRDGRRVRDRQGDDEPGRRTWRADDACRWCAACRRGRHSRNTRSGRCGQGARRIRGGRRREPRSRGLEGQAHRQPVAHHARGARRVLEVGVD